MATCPKCQASIEIPPQFFGGLFTCPKCQGVYFTNFDGVPENQSQQEVAPPAQPEYQPQESTAGMGAMEVYTPEPLVQTPQTPEPEVPAVDWSVPVSEVSPAPVPATPMDLSEVVRYGNSEPSNSPMSFRLVIQGLDLMQNVNELKEILLDSKLQIKFEDVRKLIKNGQLVLEKIPPAKAAILAQRLRSLELRMMWELKIYE